MSMYIVLLYHSPFNQAPMELLGNLAKEIYGKQKQVFKNENEFLNALKEFIRDNLNTLFKDKDTTSIVVDYHMPNPIMITIEGDVCYDHIYYVFYILVRSF